MAELTEHQKREIVEALACFQTPSAVIAHFRSEYGVGITHKQVGRYDPTRPYYEAGNGWRQIFEARRKACLEDVSEIPAAHKAYRLNMLQEGIDTARAARNWVLMARLLKQAAEEVGGAYTSQGAVQIDDPAERSSYESFKRIRSMSSEERRASVAELIRRAMEQGERMAKPPATPPFANAA